MLAGLLFLGFFVLALVGRALKNLKDGDIVMAHLGIWSRKDPFAPALDELLTGLTARGFCKAKGSTRPSSSN